MPTTQSEFLSHNANLCPNCGSSSITDEDYHWADLIFIISQSCDNCNAEWQVYARVAGYEDLETAEEQL